VTVRRGAEWAVPAAGVPDVDVRGSDVALAGVVAVHPGALVAFSPVGSDLARAIGLAEHPVGEREVTLDALLVDGEMAVNMAVVATPPGRLRRVTRRRPIDVRVDGRVVFSGRATTVVVATGQFHRGLDLVPGGHPGDGRLEVQVYALAPPERAPMRRRLATGSHLPHPRIVTAGGRRVEVALGRRAALDVDGVRRPPVSRLSVDLVPGAYRIAL
jgi:hypothetical protein